MKQIKEIAIMQSENELSIGEKALKSGNIGKARVCARRACMFAINYWLHKNQNYNWGKNAINFLENVRDENALPENVRFAARRLTERVDINFTTSNSENPLEDAKIIMNYFLSKDQSKEKND